jgi:hypothetical protein
VGRAGRAWRAAGRRRGGRRCCGRGLEQPLGLDAVSPVLVGDHARDDAHLSSHLHPEYEYQHEHEHEHKHTHDLEHQHEHPHDVEHPHHDGDQRDLALDDDRPTRPGNDRYNEMTRETASIGNESVII